TALLFITFLVASCGGKKTANTSFSINAGALLSGVSVNGGIALVGTNGVDKFSLGMSADQAQSFNLELSAGDWQFHAVAWLGSGAGVMTGETRCGSATSSIQGSEATINLSLDGATCGTDTFS